MAKVEVQREKDGYVVQVTYREPFEYFFEIAVHNARFAHPRDANHLAERVRAKLKENGLGRSYSFAISRDHWTYRSSAYSGRMGSNGQVFKVTPTPSAIRADQRQDAFA